MGGDSLAKEGVCLETSEELLFVSMGSPPLFSQLCSRCEEVWRPPTYPWGPILCRACFQNVLDVRRRLHLIPLVRVVAPQMDELVFRLQAFLQDFGCFYVNDIGRVELRSRACKKYHLLCVLLINNSVFKTRFTYWGNNLAGIISQTEGILDRIMGFV